MTTTTLDATIGGTAANTYGTLAEASTYFGDRLHTDTWDDASTDDQNKALLMACRWLDSEIDWDGYRVTETQALRHPRSNLYTRDGDSIDTTAIAPEVKYAQFELAYFLLAEDRGGDPDGIGISSLSLSGLSLAFDKNDRRPRLPDTVRNLVRHLVKGFAPGNGPVNKLRVVRTI